MKIFATAIPDIICFEPHVFGDARGFFVEAFRADQMATAGISGNFVQDNHSGSRNNILCDV